MTLFLLIIRIGIATLFISTGWSKLQKVEEHIAIVKEYRLMPQNWARTLAQLEMVIELIIGCFILIGLFQAWMGAVGAFILFIYSLAIGTNLIRGRRNISCGCGGLAGNHALSWWLVLRNIILILLVFWFTIYPPLLGSIDGVLTGQSWQSTFTMEVFVTAFLFWTVILFLLIMENFKDVHHHLLKLSQDD